MTWQRLIFDVIFGLSVCAILVAADLIQYPLYFLLGYFVTNLIFALFRKEEK